MNHYHIHWSSRDELDWQAFDSRLDAQISAGQLVRPGEAYRIEEYDESCARCRTAMTLKTSHETQNETKLKYAWQQAVLDAFQSPLETLPLKVNAAQRAISARLCDKGPADLNEQMAIREALHSLRALLTKPTPKKSKEVRPESGEKKQTA